MKYKQRQRNPTAFKRYPPRPADMKRRRKELEDDESCTDALDCKASRDGELGGSAHKGACLHGMMSYRTADWPTGGEAESGVQSSPLRHVL